jgi:CIC family chloride channel protein
MASHRAFARLMLHLPRRLRGLVLVVAATLIGAGAGLGAVLFRHLIDSFQHLSFATDWLGLGPGSGLYVLLAPAVGGLLFGPLIHFLAREAKGHGVPEVMEAVLLHRGLIRPRVALVKAFASALCIGTGGSVGREGPIAQIGSALGSTLGQWMGARQGMLQVLVACGAAGGIAATFNAPVAGAVFALELILRRLNAGYFSLVVIAGVVADAVAQALQGDFRTFEVPAYHLESHAELLWYALLGLVAGLFARAFVMFLYAFEGAWERLAMPDLAKPVLGGLLLGLLGWVSFQADAVPRIFGVGYPSVEAALVGELALPVLLALGLLKLVATSLTLGSGGSGGVFAPSLFMGAMLGGAFGMLVDAVAPAWTGPPGAYALVGMAAVFGGAAHAPVTAILILFEMTGDYAIILPLMLATVVSTLVTCALSPESIYSLKLVRRGVDLRRVQVFGSSCH